MRILVVEDEIKTGDYLKKGLNEAGYVVDLARTGTDGQHMALSEDYQIIVLDIMLPGVDGWQVIRQIREMKDTPVLCLTARDSIEERIKGLELGADDYLVKPFAFAELLARIRTLLRRGPSRGEEFIQISDMEVDVLKRRVKRAGIRIDLTATEFTLLHLLAAHQGEVLSRSRIASLVWDMNFDSDTNIVDVAIRRLRAKIDDPFSRKLVHTVRGMGYVVEGRE